MTPLQPSHDRGADSHNGAGAHTDDQPYDAIIGAPAEHLEPLQHVLKCRTCLKTLYEMFVRSMERQLADEAAADT